MAQDLLFDGHTRTARATIVIRPHIPKMALQLDMFASRSSFDGQKTIKTSTQSFTTFNDGSGELASRFDYNITTPIGENQYCYNGSFSQSMTSPGNPPDPKNPPNPTTTGTTGAINGSGCTCTWEACCLCVGHLQNDGLTITISPLADNHTDKPFGVTLVKCPDNRASVPKDEEGPRFDSETGPRHKDRDNQGAEIKCDNTPHKFNIHGGPKRGEYKIFIEYNGECYECGHVCVFPEEFDKAPNGKPLIKYTSTAIWLPPGLRDAREQPTSDEARDVLRQIEELPLPIGAICGVGAGSRLVPGTTVGGYTFAKLQEQDSATGEWKDKRYVWEGTPAKLPGGGTGRLIGRISDDCGNRIESYCTGTYFRLWYVDCEGKYYPIGVCLWPSGLNALQLYFSQCGTMYKINLIRMFNIDANRARVEDAENRFRFETCSKNMKAGLYGSVPPGSPNPEWEPRGPVQDSDQNWPQDDMMPPVSPPAP